MLSHVTPYAGDPILSLMETFMAEFNAMRKAGNGLWVGTWHPFVSGRLSRWQRVEEMIEEMICLEKMILILNKCEMRVSEMFKLIVL